MQCQGISLVNKNTQVCKIKTSSFLLKTIVNYLGNTIQLLAEPRDFFSPVKYYEQIRAETKRHYKKNPVCITEAKQESTRNENHTLHGMIILRKNDFQTNETNILYGNDKHQK